ncbi:MAG: cation:dicarboxylase symporter family transporter, partial [Chloroflexi bacterium]|nr:cation:dicarboxylase symporter family transporter [Chloroflexota bacterium]
FFITQSPAPYKQQLTDFFQGIFEVMMKLTHFIILFTPIGVFALMSKTIAQTGFDVILPLVAYMATVASALLIHAVVTLPILLYFVSGVNPLAYATSSNPRQMYQKTPSTTRPSRVLVNSTLTVMPKKVRTVSINVQYPSPTQIPATVRSLFLAMAIMTNEVGNTMTKNMNIVPRERETSFAST